MSIISLFRLLLRCQISTKLNMSLTSIFLYLNNRTKPAKAEYAKPRFEMPMFVIMGQKDYILKFPALKDYISSEKLKEIAPDHEITYIPKGSHFVQEQFPELVNQLMIDFLCKHA